MDAIPTSEVSLLAVRYAHLVRDLDLAPGEPLLVLPNNEFFPDLFQGDQASMERLVARLSGYAGLEDVEIEAQLLGAASEADCSSGSCGTGGCGDSTGARGSSQGVRIVPEGERYRVEVPAPLLADSIVLTARLSTAMASIYLLERHPRAEEAALDSELAEAGAVALGFGVLLLEASYLYRKGCGGPQVGSGTLLDCQSLAILLGLFLAREQLAAGPVRSELGTTQRALFAEAHYLIEQSPTLVQALRSDPARVARGGFTVGDGKGWFSRLFSRSRPQRDSADAALAALERGASLDEVQALLESGRGRG